MTSQPHNKLVYEMIDLFLFNQKACYISEIELQTPISVIIFSRAFQIIAKKKRNSIVK